MAFIIPNASDTGASRKFDNINQAEPDSLDMEALGNMLTACIRSGGEVTNSGNTINIAAGVAIFGGVPYPFNASSFTNTSASATAFSAVVVRLSGGTASVVRLDGTPSSTNPTLPKSASTLTGTYNAATDYSPATDVLLATVVRSGSTVAGHIVDKRIMFTGSLHWTQATAPLAAQGNNGDLVTVSSTVYVKASGSWMTVSSQSVVDEIMPIGGIMTWPSLKNPPGLGTRWLECNGQAVTAAAYPALASAWGVTGTFNLPNYGSQFLRGTTSTGTGLISENGGADSVEVPLKNHAHTLNNHTHNFPTHSHTASVTGSDGTHTHSGSLASLGVQVNLAGGHTHNPPAGADVFTVQTLTGGAAGFEVATKSAFQYSASNVYTTAAVGDHTHTANVTNGSVTVTSSGSNHGHTITVSPPTGGTVTDPPSTANTGTTGDGATPTISTLSAYRSVRYFVRAV